MPDGESGRGMVSLKKYMIEHCEQQLQFTLESYRSAIAAFAEKAARVCPTLADSLSQKMLTLRDRVSRTAADEVPRIEQDLERELDTWSAGARDYYQKKAEEVRELMLAMAGAANSVGARDQKYRNQFRELSTRLQEAGNLEDLTRIRNLIRINAAALRSSVDRMVEEGQQSIAQLQTQLAAYQQRLAEAERVSATDPLTGLANRAAIERDIEQRINSRRPFCLMVVDLNDFKRVNDTNGHAAGDYLLKCFAVELKAQFSSADSIGRWGGDEFVGLIDGTITEAEARAQRVRDWVIGEYALSAGPEPVKVMVSAAIGVSEWRAGISPETLFSQADRAMYAEKAHR